MHCIQLYGIASAISAHNNLFLSILFCRIAKLPLIRTCLHVNILPVLVIANAACNLALRQLRLSRKQARETSIAKSAHHVNIDHNAGVSVEARELEYLSHFKIECSEAYLGTPNLLARTWSTHCYIYVGLPLSINKYAYFPLSRCVRKKLLFYLLHPTQSP